MDFIMKRILFYTDTPLLGGAENQMLTLARFLPKDKYTITLACSSFQKLNPWCQKFLDEGMEVVRLKVLHKHDPRHFFYLKTLLKNFDLLHMHVWNPASGRYGFLASGKIPLIITEHDPFPLKGLKGRLKEKFLQKTRIILVTSQAAKRLVLEQDQGLESKIAVVPNGIDIEAWRASAKLEDRNAFRRIHFNATPHDKILLCAAELHKRKGQKYLIEAVKQLLPDFPMLKLVLAGDGPERNAYQKMALGMEGRIHLLGRQKNVAQLMMASDVFILPSIREAFGLVLLEAAAIRLPIIASYIGGIPEIIENEKTGVLVPSGDAKALAAAIGTLCKNFDLANAFAAAAQKKTDQLFDAKTMAMKTAQVYDSILAPS